MRMKNLDLAGAILLTLAVLLTGEALAGDQNPVVKLGSLEIHGPAIQETPPRAPVTGGYMTIVNNGELTERLVSARAPFAGKVEIHTMSIQDDVMKMRRLENGLEIRAGETVHLQPGGFHLMLMRLDEQMRPGEMRDVTLVFEEAGELVLPMPVKARSEIAKRN